MVQTPFNDKRETTKSFIKKIKAKSIEEYNLRNKRKGENYKDVRDKKIIVNK